MLESAGRDELIPVRIVLADQLTGQVLRARIPQGSRKDARATVVAALRAHAQAQQAPLLAQLDKALRQGRAARVRPLWIANAILAELAPEIILALAARPDVAHIDHDPKRRAFLATGCGVVRIGAPEVWSSLYGPPGHTGAGVVVATIDTGVCYDHLDIAGQIWTNPGEVPDGADNDFNGFIDDLRGWDWEGGDNDPWDEHFSSHGSQTAGIVAGDGTGGTQAGVAPDAKIMVLRVGNTDAAQGDVMQAMQYAVDNGADVINLSLGYSGLTDQERLQWQAACGNAIEAGAVVVAAAGNWGGDPPSDPSGYDPPNEITTPGDVPRVITVGATDCSDAIWPGSSRGPVIFPDDLPAWTKPDVVAPGVHTDTHLCSGYTNAFSGTSLAAPHVSGTVALMLSRNPDLTHDQIKAILEATAVDLGPQGKDNTFGAGRIDAYAAVYGTCPPAGECGAAGYCQPAVPEECTSQLVGYGCVTSSGQVLQCPAGLWITNCACETLVPGTPCSATDQSWQCRTCGDGVRDPGEMCDGSDLGGETCQSQGFDSGTLACQSDCLGFGTMECLTQCGNNVRGMGEWCDGTDLGGETCQSLGFDAGTLACQSGCHGFDTSSCRDFQCNNGFCEPGESCSTCPGDCAGKTGGPPSGRFCCGNGIVEQAEGNGDICDGNY